MFELTISFCGFPFPKLKLFHMTKDPMGPDWGDWGVWHLESLWSPHWSLGPFHLLMVSSQASLQMPAWDPPQPHLQSKHPRAQVHWARVWDHHQARDCATGPEGRKEMTPRKFQKDLYQEAEEWMAGRKFTSREAPPGLMRS